MNIITTITNLYLRLKWSEARDLAQSRIRTRQRVYRLLSTPMSKSDVIDYNNSLFANSAGQLGGGWDEKFIKQKEWQYNRHLFKGKKFKDIAKFRK